MERIRQRMIDQAGVVSRRQLHAAGYAPHDIERMVRRRDLTPMFPGVYLGHTGEPTWLERAWIGLLAVSSEVDVSDVALAHRSALRIAEGPGRRDSLEDPVHVAIPDSRRVRSRPGVVVHRTAWLADRRHPRKVPPRIRYEEAVLDVAAELADFDALEVLTRAVGGRYSTASRLLAAAQHRPWLRRRTWLVEILADIDQGTHSVLEHAFLEKITRPHGFPAPMRQRRDVTAIGVVYRDAAYRDLIIELDGRLHHSEMRQRSADLERDLYAAAEGMRTVRLGWGQVVGRPCHTAAALSRLLGRGRPCGAECPVQGDVRKS